MPRGFDQPGFQEQFGFGPPRTQKFQQYFRCFPISLMPGKEREDLNYGGKVVLPPSALMKLVSLHITYPMLFQITSEETQLTTHAGVLEFIAEEGRIYMPNWMMQTIGVETGSILQITSTDLPLGSFVKIEPQSTDFLDISDPKSVLENALRNFSSLTVDDVFQISYNNRSYGIKVLEVKPDTQSHSICVIETDLEVDFAPPVGYVEPSRPSTPASSNVPSRTFATPVGTMGNTIGYDRLARVKIETDPFASGGQKLSGRPISNNSNTNSVEQEQPPAPLSELSSVSDTALNLPFGQLFFGFPVIPVKHSDEELDREEKENASNSHNLFKGTGQSLKKSRKRKGDIAGSSATESRSPRPKSNSPEYIEID